LKGRYFWNKRSEDGFVKAIDYFGQAIKRDPKYAQAHAGLADAYALLGSMSNLKISRAEAMPKAKAAALQALQLDDSLAEAHTSLAFVEMQYEWNWPSSEKEFKRALELNSSYATAHQWYAVWLMAQGKTSAALEEARRAQEADPLSVIIKTDTAQLLGYAGRYDEATHQAQAALEIDPDFPLAHIFLGEAYVGKQQYPAAIAEFQKTLVTNQYDAGALSELSRTYAYDGQRSKSEATLAILQKKLRASKDGGEFAIQVAAVHAALGKKEQAFAALEEAYQYRVGSLILMTVTPVFQSLRPDPRFDDLARRVGIPYITEHR
jgi:tetratricopeptide (TPR) repeat protein